MNKLPEVGEVWEALTDNSTHVGDFKYGTNGPDINAGDKVIIESVDISSSSEFDEQRNWVTVNILLDNGAKAWIFAIDFMPDSEGMACFRRI